MKFSQFCILAAAPFLAQAAGEIGGLLLGFMWTFIALVTMWIERGEK